jgi:hypothetical protein
VSSHAPRESSRSMQLAAPPCSAAARAWRSAAASSRSNAPRRAAAACAGLALQQPPCAVSVRPWRRRAATARPEASAEQDELAWERRLAAPRMEAGLDVHRRVHVLACKHAAYLFQWRAFCERQGRSFQDTLSDEDEAVLACACAPALRALALGVSRRAVSYSVPPRDRKEPVPVRGRHRERHCRKALAAAMVSACWRASPSPDRPCRALLRLCATACTPRRACLRSAQRCVWPPSRPWAAHACFHGAPST